MIKNWNEFNEGFNADAEIGNADAEMNVDYNWGEFMIKWNLEPEDLVNRTYSVDSSNEYYTLQELVESNCDAVMCNNILELEEYIPLEEILNLEVGETYEPGGAMGADVKRIS